MRNNKFLWRVTLMFTSSLTMAGIGMSPMLSGMAKAFPDASDAAIQFVMTVPSIIVIVIGFVFAFLSERIPNNILTGAGCLIGVLMGVGACFIHPAVGILYFWSALLGTGSGLSANGQSVLANKLFTEKEKPGILGLQTFAASIFAMLMTFVGGFLADIEWSLGYLVYLIAIPGMLGCFLFLPNVIKPLERTLEEKPGAENASAPAEENSGKLRVAQLIPVVLAAFITNISFNVSATNLSMFVEEQKLGTAAQAGTAATVMLLVGGLAGLAFSLLYKRIRSHLVTLGLLLLAIGYVVVFFSKAYWMLILACVIFGGSISFVMSCLTMRCFQIGGKKTALAVAILLAGAHTGTLLAPVMTNISKAVFGSSDVRFRFLLTAVIAGISAVIAAVFIILRSRKERSLKG
ncbi:MAG: MFS transporter [Lachnospiraceae bacterium]|nr:MFS transporter [Lachnospiraceae bacterium]